ncbi:hypothetical protein JZ751_008984 [Albula glossodonta]|uniref:Uncharacterized protein n=1 Tax=Albula glossodonta TaxID=121402 RepID=A0A8T2P8F3_9TELE|nr:hypothetical protein JZ751_008984 [Albula glossodonta]
MRAQHTWEQSQAGDRALPPSHIPYSKHSALLRQEVVVWREGNKQCRDRGRRGMTAGGGPCLRADWLDLLLPLTDMMAGMCSFLHLFQQSPQKGDKGDREREREQGGRGGDIGKRAGREREKGEEAEVSWGWCWNCERVGGREKEMANVEEESESPFLQKAEDTRGGLRSLGQEVAAVEKGPGTSPQSACLLKPRLSGE